MVQDFKFVVCTVSETAQINHLNSGKKKKEKKKDYSDVDDDQDWRASGSTQQHDIH